MLCISVARKTAKVNISPATATMMQTRLATKFWVLPDVVRSEPNAASQQITLRTSATACSTAAPSVTSLARLTFPPVSVASTTATTGSAVT